MPDAEALSMAVRGDGGMMALIKAAPDRDVEIVTSALTTIQAWDPQVGRAA
ncbi:hypothetical protein [Streptomyces sp. V3I7]|uniref:hypothetical protein n=1 Tax=Streptomyces sp. V3I7 TaxID=3042278 RepID=UPI002783D787|nr:hypothetical protein [Streptomyces sp. V3I7]MDQ0992853.1 hypothetical protein [Streptomyces sp. V3I7]